METALKNTATNSASVGEILLPGNAMKSEADH